MSNATAPGIVAFRSLIELHGEHSRLMECLEEQGDNPIGLRKDIDIFIARAVATGARLNLTADRADVQSILTYWNSVLQASGPLTQPTVLAAFDKTLATEQLAGKNPYKGLLAFQADDADLFFGRRDLIREMLQVLKKERTLAVLGISGSGKSSVVRAGVIPFLLDGALPGSKNWRYLGPIVPGADPIGCLADAVRPEGEDPEIWRARQGGELRRSHTHLLRLLEGQTETILVVDQLEEIFTLAPSDSDQQSYCANLARLIQGSHRHRLILTMRSEFDALLMQTPLADVIKESRVRVPSLQASELREAIEKPAERFGVSFDPDVVQSLVKNVQNEPAGLPLLQFALLKLWQEHNGEQVSKQSYEALGGSPQQILVNAADETYRSLKILEAQERCRSLFLSLVKPGTGIEVTGRRRYRSDLNYIGPPETIEGLLTLFQGAGLLRITAVEQSGNSLIELSHESLTRNWPELVKWVRENLGLLRRRQLLEETAEQWTRAPQKVTLYSGGQLKEAGGFPGLTEKEQKFLAASRTHEKANANRRFILLALLMVLSATLLLSAIWTFRKTKSLEKDLQTPQQKVITAENQLEQKRAELLAVWRDNNDAISLLTTSDKIPKSKKTQLSPAGRAAIYIQIPREDLRDLARQMIESLRSLDPTYLLPGIQLPWNPSPMSFPNNTEVRFFHPEDRSEAERMAEALSQFKAVVWKPYTPMTETKLAGIPRRHFEIWVGLSAKAAGK